MDELKRRICRELLDERFAQDVQWGGPAHDDTHDLNDWLRFIEAQITAARAEVDGHRKRLVKIGALAVAAIESCDRGAC